ncbi:MAG: EI24 domain-containing protein [Myxococcota bacterium]
MAQGPSFIEGAGAVLDGLGVLGRDPAQRRRAIVPVFLTVLLYGAALAVVVWAADPLLALLWAEPSPGWDFLRILWLVLRWSLAAALFVVACFLFMAVLEIVAGPFLDAIASHELRRADLTPTDTGLWDGAILEAFRALLMALPLLALSVAAFIPPLTIPATVLATGWAWFGLGSGAVNPSLVQSGLRFRRRVSFGLRYFPFVMGLGAVIGLCLFVPVVGWLGLPSAVAGAARAWARHAADHGA